MYYLPETDYNVNDDINTRKEFYQYNLQHIKDLNPLNTEIIPRFMLNDMINKGDILQLHSYQSFITNYMNPNTPYTRLLIKWQTGTGKSIGAICMALNFIKYYKTEDIIETNIGSVFIIGFTAHIFKNELLRFPEFGIITHDELLRLRKLRIQAYSGSNYDIEMLYEFLTKIRKKFSNRSGNGFFEFIGYKKLATMIFIIKDKNINISELDEGGIVDAIANNKIVLNAAVLDKFKNSILICDEIHNVYNSLNKNNWGIALQYILNHHDSIRAVFMSATPINNSPTELVDLLNLLLPRKHYTELKKEDLFDIDKNLKPESTTKIVEYCKGRISYMRDSNPKYYPTKQYIGEIIPGASYLKFIRCPMSKFHYDTYKASYTGVLSHDSQYLTDFAIPNPSDPNIGLYQTSEIEKLSHASQSWKTENKINFINDKIVGDILQLKNLYAISTKYSKMMETINDIIINQRGKIFIYHNNIHMSGVLFIQEILLQNYIIGEYDSSTDNTLCAVCGKVRKDHTKDQIGGTTHITYETNEFDVGTSINNQIDLTLCKIHKTVKYNYTTNHNEIYNNPNHTDSNQNSILEYIIYDDIIVIQDAFLDMKYKIDIQEILKILIVNFKVIIKTNRINIELEKIINNLHFYIICADSITNNVFFANSIFKIDKQSKQSFLRNLNKRLNNIHTKCKIKKGGSKELPKIIDPNHTFMPVRFIALHSELLRRSMDDSLVKYNSDDNSNGHRIMILVGGRLMKEAFDIKAIREVMIMGRPDNIQTLIQILGRSIRNNSHRQLPVNSRNVNIRIFTSCLPNKINIPGSKTGPVYDIGCEEQKYIEKIKTYKIIQKIEKILHENAIDAFTNRNIIWNEEDRKMHNEGKLITELGDLYFEANISKKLNSYTFKSNELNLQTFDAYYQDSEITNTVVIIKRLFIEKSSVWEYTDLFHMVKTSMNYFRIEFNTNLISEDSFIIALSKLVWTDGGSYVEPIIDHLSEHNTKYIQNDSQHNINMILTKLYDTDDKIIIIPGGQRSMITQVGKYYIMFPLDEIKNIPIKMAELPYRVIKHKNNADIDVRSFIENNNTESQYISKRNRFFNRWNNIPIEKLEMAVCDFGTDFHISFLEECIEYIFKVWTDAHIKKSVMHTFFFKMVNYYDLHKLVVWGHTLKPYLLKKYVQYLKPVSIKMLDKKTSNINKKLAENDAKNQDTSGVINMLKSSLNKSGLNWISTGLKHQFNDNLDKSLKLFDGNYKKSKTNTDKVNADLVPVGHFLGRTPKFYHPLYNWYESPEYANSDEVLVENNIIVGYDERSHSGIHIRFKIRTPIHNIKQFKDTRLVEKGTVCTSKSKMYLQEISKKIGIDNKSRKKNNVTTICDDIRTRLIYLELKERIAKTNIKWFYFIYEKRPETVSN